jgi:hypothetical protein
MEPINEAEVTNLDLPDESFLAQYVTYGYERGDSPLIYHLAVGLAALAVCAPKGLSIDTLPGGMVYPNFWCIISGRPAVDHKSTAIKFGRQLLTRSHPLSICDDPGTYEGLAEAMQANKGQLLLILEEFGDFLARTEGSGYAQKLKSNLLKYYDCDPITRRLAKRIVRVPEPRLSIVGAVNPSLIQRHAEMQDWEGGFMSRWCIFYAHKERDSFQVEPNPARMEWLTERVRYLAQSKVGPCLGLSPAAASLWESWNADLLKRIEGTSNLPHLAAYGRTPTLAAKVALLMSLDFGTANPDPWHIEEGALVRAIQVAELHYRSAFHMAEFAHADKDMRDRFAVLHAITTDWRPYGDILRDASILRTRGECIVETLLEEGAVDRKVIQGRAHLRLQASAPDDALDVVDPKAAHLVRIARAMTDAPINEQ